MKRARWWAERGAFLASVLALLATSKPPSWTLRATITGPTTPAASKALSLSIDASDRFTIYASGVPATFGGAKDAPCLETFVPGVKTTCLLPPGASLDVVQLAGNCGGCSSHCGPPPTAYGKVEAKEVDVSIDGETKSLAVSLPSHAKYSTATQFALTASGASFIRAHMTVRPRGGGKTIFDEDQSCPLDGAPHHARCFFSVDDAVLGGLHDADVDVEATGYDACATPGCAPPKTFHVDSFAVLL